MKLTSKLILLVATIISLIVVANIFLLGKELRGYLEESQLEWVETLAGGLSESVAQDTIDGNRIRVRELLRKISMTDEAIEFAFVTDMDGHLFAHSFDGGFPRFLANDLKTHPNVTYKASLDRVYNTRQGLIHEFDAPLIAGMSATLHLGLNQSEINTQMQEVNRKLVWLPGLIGLIGISLALFIGRRISLPLSQFTDQLRHYGEGDEIVFPKLQTTDPDTRQLVNTFQTIITARTKAEEKSRKNEQNLSLTLNSIGDAVIATDAESRITRMNPIAEQLTGWTFDEACGRLLDEIFPIIHASTRESIETPVNRVLATGEILTLANHTTLIAKDGREYQIADSAAPIQDEKNNIVGVILVFHDVTEQYQLRQATARSERRLQLHRKQTPLGIIEWNTDFEVIDWNPAAERIFGFNREEALGQHAVGLIVPESARHAVSEVWHDLLANIGGRRSTNENITKDKRTILCDWYNTSLMDEEGRVVGVTSVVDDITERRQTEEALRRSQKMEAIGQLSGGIAHDFNNQLGVIIGCLDFLYSQADEKGKSKKWVETATRATQRCITLTRQLLNFSRKQAVQKSVVELNSWIKQMDSMIARSVTPEVDVQFRLTNNLWPVELDTGEFHDALLNMVINARDAMPKGGNLVIETSNAYLDEGYTSITPEVKPGDYVQLILSDTGTGMSAETLKRVFEPFFTTKPTGKGTGLGMAMAYGFVKRHGGHIKIYSEFGVGTTVHLYLPRAQDGTTPQTPGGNTNGSILPTGTETVLIVDDEQDLLYLANEYLSESGYQTLLAKDAAQALEILSGNEPVDILFSDVVMSGGINGYELAQKAVDMHPELKVLLTSGFTSETMAENGSNKFSPDLLRKPYRKLDLIQKIREVLDVEDKS